MSDEGQDELPTAVMLKQSNAEIDPQVKRRGENLGLALIALGAVGSMAIVLISYIENRMGFKLIPVVIAVLVLTVGPGMWLYNNVATLKYLEKVKGFVVRKNGGSTVTDAKQDALADARQALTDERVEKLEDELRKFRGKNRRSGTGKREDRKVE